ncbi:hypothetical protein JVX90_11440 [Gordonia sp. PDNC005]|nr:hypothetical protein [Gordonia sp. PDNC005]QRY61063.1 hypothetical protein JVX90_11440 [Gordonia sp. PDNC005]
MTDDHTPAAGCCSSTPASQSAPAAASCCSTVPTDTVADNGRDNLLAHK